MRDIKSKHIIQFFLLVVPLSFLFLISQAFPAYAADHYVRSGAAGANNGNNWADAWNALPAVLTRGDTYYIADGVYDGYAFDDAESGTSIITIKKATVAAHGTDEGWNSSYGDGVAEFSATLGTGALTALSITRGYYAIDGVTGGGPGNWDSGHGIQIVDPSDDRVLIIIGDGTRPVSNIELKHLKMSGGYIHANCNIADYETRAIRASNSSVKSNISISHCFFSDFAGPAINFQNFNNLVFEYNLNDRWHSGPYCHGSGLRMDNFHHTTVRYNNFRNGAGSNWVGAYNGPNHDLFVYGNIFACDEAKNNCSGSPALISSEHTTGDPDIYNMYVYNNTFHNIFGAVPNMIGAEDGDNSDNDAVYAENNLFYGCDITGTYVSATGTMRAYHSYNAGDESISEDAGFQLLTSSPFLSEDPANESYLQLSGATIAGSSLDLPYNSDMFGNIRAADGIWDRGAYEYTESADDTTPPAAPSGLDVQ